MNYREVADILKNVQLPDFDGDSAWSRRCLHEELYKRTGEHVSDHVLGKACEYNVDRDLWARFVLSEDSRQFGYTKAMTEVQKLRLISTTLEKELTEAKQQIGKLVATCNELRTKCADTHNAAKVLAKARKSKSVQVNI